jgi:hypothetical protein
MALFLVVLSRHGRNPQPRCGCSVDRAGGSGTSGIPDRRSFAGTEDRAGPDHYLGLVLGQGRCVARLRQTLHAAKKTLYLPRNRRGKGRQARQRLAGRIQGARAPDQHRVQAPYPPCPSVRRTNGNIPTPWRATVRPVRASLPLVARRNPTGAASSSFRVSRP